MHSGTNSGGWLRYCVYPYHFIIRPFQGKNRSNATSARHLSFALAIFSVTSLFIMTSSHTNASYAPSPSRNIATFRPICTNTAANVLSDASFVRRDSRNMARFRLTNARTPENDLIRATRAGKDLSRRRIYVGTVGHNISFETIVNLVPKNNT